MIPGFGTVRIAAIALALVAAGTAAAKPPSVVDRAVQAGCRKGIVLLGELPSHGEARAFEAKADIVKGLVERCGFDAVLFEAPVYEFDALRHATRGRETAPHELDNAIGGFWTTNELAGWRGWLLTRVANGRLYVGGIDDQPGATSVLTRRELPGLVAGAVPDARQAQCRESVRRHLEWAYTDEAPLDAAERTRLAECAGAADARLSAARPPYDATARAAAAFMRYTGREARLAGAPARDASMLATLESHLAALPRNSRVVVWTSTVHAARMQGGRPYTPLGEWLAGSRKKRLLSIGFTALAGSSSMAGAKVKPLEPAPPDSLEAQALGARDEAAFVDGTALARLDGRPSRLFGAFGRHAWSRHFDAVIVFRTETPPTFRPRP